MTATKPEVIICRHPLTHHLGMKFKRLLSRSSDRPTRYNNIRYNTQYMSTRNEKWIWRLMNRKYNNLAYLRLSTEIQLKSISYCLATHYSNYLSRGFWWDISRGLAVSAEGFERIWFGRRVLEDLEIYGGSYGIYGGLEDSAETCRDLRRSECICRKSMEGFEGIRRGLKA